MAYQKDQLKPYEVDIGKTDFIPIHIWNKQKQGKERGKTPIHQDWVNRKYVPTAVNGWITKGYNLGYRIAADEVIIDIDPRNFDGLTDSLELVAELMGYFDFDELTEDLPVVQTGGGGWHIYCTLPQDLDYMQLRETVDELPGVEFKRKGRQVLAAGSRHPSGNYYSWVNTAKRKPLSKQAIELIKRTTKRKNTEYSTGKGCLTGTQLEELILSKLDPEDYASNDKWFPLLCAAHHATDGQGVEEFVAWSTQDLEYSGDENVIRSRWESLWDKDNSITIGTLIHQLEQNGEDTKDVKAMLSFSAMDYSEDDDEDGDQDSESNGDEEELLNNAKRIASEIDLSDIYHEPELEEGVEGKALALAERLTPMSDQQEIIKCIRLIKAADSLEAMRAQELLVGKKVLKQSSINKLLKDLDAKINDDLALLISNKTLELTFNKGKHITCPPSGVLYAFHKTHWKPISDEFLGKLVQGTIHALKTKMDIEANEVTLIGQAVKLSRIRSATLTDKLHRTDLPHSVINCKNGELWLDKDGSHTLKPHNYRSYLINCLNVNYDPGAKCPLFMQTLNEIFSKFPDTADMVRHIGELLGYTIQPYKNMASWWLFRGPGGDGKSTILKILEGVLQDAQLNTGAKLLSSGASDGYAHATHSLVGKLAVVIEELPANYLLKDAGVKMFSENTKMEANPKGRDAFNFMYAGNLIMCSNGFPATRDLSHGMFRRANVVPFNRQFTKGNTEDIDRAAKILQDKEEMSGVLNFMLEGLQRLRDRGHFALPDSCLEAKEEWFGEANNVVRFVKETIDMTNVATDCLGDFSNLYGMIYHRWCQENDIDDKMRKRKSHFKQDLTNLGLVVRYGGGNVLKVYGGLLKEDLEWQEDEDF